MKKIVSTAAALLLALSMLAGCSSGGDGSSAAGSSALSGNSDVSAAEKTKLNVFAIKGPTGVGMVNLMKEDEDGNTGNDYSFQIDVYKRQIYAYGFAFTSFELDDAVLRLSELLPVMLRLAEVEKSTQLLAAEIEKTRRRVNALEHVMRCV